MKGIMPNRRFQPYGEPNKSIDEISSVYTDSVDDSVNPEHRIFRDDSDSDIPEPTEEMLRKFDHQMSRMYRTNAEAHFIDLSFDPHEDRDDTVMYPW